MPCALMGLSGRVKCCGRTCEDEEAGTRALKRACSILRWLYVVLGVKGSRKISVRDLISNPFPISELDFPDICLIPSDGP